MLPAFWFTINVKNWPIPIPLLPLLPLFFGIELLAFIPLVIYAISKKDGFILKIAVGFYLSRFFLALILYGRKLAVNVYDNNQRICMAGKMLFSKSRNRSQFAIEKTFLA